MDENLEKIVQEILGKGYLMSLATVDENGPWVADVIYLFDSTNLYWMSKTFRRHSQALLKEPRVACTITISNNQGEDNLGLQISGAAEKLEGPQPKLGDLAAQKRKKDSPVVPSDDESWYKLTPNKIEIICEPRWGYDKKELDLK